jgi:hypothetical protein
VVAKVTEMLFISKQATEIYMDRFYVTKLNSVKVKEKCQVIILNRFTALKSFDANVDIIELEKY